jgi:hypothetical protein
MAECDQEIERLTRQLDSRIDPEQKPPSPAPSLAPSQIKRRKNQFHCDDMSSQLHRVLGVDLTAIPGIRALTTHTLITEIGPDLSRFHSAAAFARLGAPQAITATAHKLARILYHLLTTGQPYDETVFLVEDQKQAQRHEKRLRKQAQNLGFQLLPIAL